MRDQKRTQFSTSKSELKPSDISRSWNDSITTAITHDVDVRGVTLCGSLTGFSALKNCYSTSLLLVQVYRRFPHHVTLRQIIRVYMRSRC